MSNVSRQASISMCPNLRLNPLLAIVALAVYSHANAASWELVVTTSAATAWVDTSSIRTIDGKARVWVKFQMTKAVPVFHDKPSPTFILAKQLSIYDCRKRTSATLQVARYASEESSPVDQDNTPEALATFSEVVPDTMADRILSFVCQSATKSKK